ncbi:MAG: hypothetical protein LBG58_03045 [Planctomycetaceae bacterium]|nr:hypothetical protein [Planctomycetaceae bacterium]
MESNTLTDGSTNTVADNMLPDGNTSTSTAADSSTRRDTDSGQSQPVLTRTGKVSPKSLWAYSRIHFEAIVRQSARKRY